MTGVKVSHPHLWFITGPNVGNNLASRIGNIAPGTRNTSEARSVAATRVFQNIRSDFYISSLDQS
jgi:hypothetical protein